MGGPRYGNHDVGVSEEPGQGDPLHADPVPFGHHGDGSTDRAVLWDNGLPREKRDPLLLTEGHYGLGGSVPDVIAILHRYHFADRLGNGHLLGTDIRYADMANLTFALEIREGADGAS